jgi:hypothetical protein
MNKLKTFSTNKVNYRIEEDVKSNSIKFFVKNPSKVNIPKSLYKYYPLSVNSVDSLKNHYLFSSHPMLLNDKYDCFEGLIDYSKSDLKGYLNHRILNQRLSRNKIIQIYESGKKLFLERTLSELNQIYLYRKIGLISLTRNIKDAKMWAYYTQNNGFAIRFRTTHLSNLFFGPFPINYMKNFRKIDATKYNIALCILYSTNIKNIIWKAEDEWRYLTNNNNGNYHPFYNTQDIKSRYFNYDKESIQEIILGYDFVNPDEIDYSKRTQEFDIVNLNLKSDKQIVELKNEILSFITDNNIPCSQIVKHRSKFALDKKEIKIEKLEHLIFKISNPFKFLIDYI